MRAVPLLLAMLSLAGCAARVAPPPASTLQVPQQWRAPLPDGGSGLPVDAAWWQSFDDPALAALVSTALANNGDLRVARERIEDFRARVRAASAALQPTLSFDTSATRTRTLSAVTGQPYVTNVFPLEVQAAYELDVWGRLANATAAAAATLRGEQANLEAVGLSIAANVASGYLNLRGLDAQLELAQATLALRARSRDLARRQFEVGYSSRLEWLQAQAEYDTAAEQVPQLQRQIFEQENALALLSGASPGPIARGRTLAELVPPPVPSGLPSDLLRRRPDIARAEQAIVAANAQLAATRDQLLPTFRLTAAGGIQSGELSDLLHAPARLWRLTGTLAAPLFDAGRVQAATDSAAAVRNQALVTYENTVRQAFVETENGLDAVTRLREQVVQNDARRATAAETLRIAHNRYANGYAAYLEELDAQRSLYAADVARLQLRARLLTASVDLYRVMGGGYSAPAGTAR
ncbi:NodT family efflux transporter outer membrane factor (OMF) lipoprotein [Pseudoduganella lurida]|uniref:NodT family efflux transporter outer membrane factor (OMF) lipoprotein n=1 Tax=Pseudoduganella lurida TaxID=1036180 RepID=A0A562R5P9_9BURK|nr:efflux transporter outer membrane subunit [Pseudoduganella lurida]TWI64399.1 NodT family efflux transporter outer membrane factor (OMF) lipoprotein [Pseudoduganella lurida]